MSGFTAVRGVLFDAGNTLIWLDHARMAEIATTAGVLCTTDRMWTAELRARPRLDPLLGHTPRRESPHVRRRYVELIVEGLGAPPELVGGLRAAIADAWAELWIRPPADARPTLTALRDRGFALGCVSNSDGQVDRRLAEAGLLDLLDSVTDSGEHGIEKPDPRLFALGAARLGLPPGEIAYVGDLYSIDVVGARAAALIPVLIDPLDLWDVDCEKIRALSDLLALLPASVS